MKNIILLGASGYTGKITLAALIARGIKPVIAGRNQEKLSSLSQQYGGLEIQIADINNADSIQSIVSEGDILLTTVGPFMNYGRPALEAAVAKKAHYIDCTGEADFIHQVVKDFHQPALDAGITMLSAAAYDYIPGQCVAAVALDDAGASATRIDVGYYGVGELPMKLSGGTMESILNLTVSPCQFYRSGQLTEDLGGTRLRHFHIKDKSRPAISVSSSESFFLPSSYPQLTDVNVYLGWFGKASYVLFPSSIMNKYLVMIPGFRRAFKKVQPYIFTSHGRGPNEAERKLSCSQIIAIAYDKEGNELSTALLEGVNGYTYTGDILAWTAEQLMQGKQKTAGAIGPVEAFGLDHLIKGCEESGLSLVK